MSESINFQIEHQQVLRNFSRASTWLKLLRTAPENFAANTLTVEVATNILKPSFKTECESARKKICHLESIPLGICISGSHCFKSYHELIVAFVSYCLSLHSELKKCESLEECKDSIDDCFSAWEMLGLSQKADWVARAKQEYFAFPDFEAVQKALSAIKPGGREACCLLVMLENKITSAEVKKPQSWITRRAINGESNDHRRVFTKLESLGLVQKGTNGRGYFLSDLGIKAAKLL